MKKRVIAALLIVLAAVCTMNSTAFADWYDDVKSGSTWVKIEGENFVADTFYGVDALYNENDVKHQCYQLVERFYREAYGLNILAVGGMVGYDDAKSGPYMRTSGYDMVKTKTAKVGDIIFVTGAMRGSQDPHWAIVKDIGGGYITMFEQNVVWEGKAAVNRKIKYPSDSYYIYTPVNISGGPAPVLRHASGSADAQTQPSAAVSTAKPTTTPKETTAETPTTTERISTTKEVTTTKKVTTTKETTTIKPTTTKKVTTTVKPTTTKPTTTRAVTTTKLMTTAPVTTTAVSTTAAETTSEWYYTYNYNYTYASAQTETDFYSYEEYTENATEEKDGSNILAIIIGFMVAGAFVCGIAVLVVVLMNKKK